MVHIHTRTTCICGDKQNRSVVWCCAALHCTALCHYSTRTTRSTCTADRLRQSDASVLSSPGTATAFNVQQIIFRISIECCMHQSDRVFQGRLLLRLCHCRYLYRCICVPGAPTIRNLAKRRAGSDQTGPDLAFPFAVPNQSDVIVP